MNRMMARRRITRKQRVVRSEYGTGACRPTEGGKANATVW